MSTTQIEKSARIWPQTPFLDHVGGDPMATIPENTLSAAASDLLALVERESEAWPFVGTVEVDGDVLSVRSFTDPRGVLMLGKHYTLVGIRGVKTLSRIDALRCLEAFIRYETESAVVAAGELVTA